MNVINYLHLTWAGYNNDDIFNIAKQNIQKKYTDLLKKIKNLKLSTDLNEIEQIYRASAQDMQDFTKEQFEIKGYDENLKTIDNAVSQLEIKKGKIKEPEKYINIFNSIIPVLDRITKKYTGDDNDLAELKNYISQLKTLVKAIKAGNIKKIDENFIIKLRKYLQTNVSGIAFEIFLTAAFIDANIKTLEAINLNNQQLEKIIHAGNKSGVEGICSLDPQIAKDYEKGKFALELIDKEPGVDVILKYNRKNGGTVITNFEGLQLKNYLDIDHIPFGGRANLTLQQIGINEFFKTEYDLVNAVAALGQNVRGIEGAPQYLINLVNKQNSSKTQGELNQEWIEVMGQIRQLAGLDSIINNKLSYLNQASYYVIRDKRNKQIKVLSKYDILTHAEEAFQFKNYSFKEIKRYTYSDLNQQYFIDTKEENKQDSNLRSQKAFPAILKKLYNTKIDVAFNAANLKF